MTAPLVPSECTMAGNDWFPLHFDRLRRSKWWRRATDLARARNVMLWGEAYKQVPAGSMPDDADDLAEAAGFGMDVEGFLAVKAEIMAPWVLCSDGRWYHPTVCEVVLEAWERASEKKKAAAAKKAGQRAKTRGQALRVQTVPAETADVPLEDQDVPGDRPEKQGDIDTHNRQDRTGQTEQSSDPDGSGGQPPDEDSDPLAELKALPIATGAWRLGLRVLMDQGGMTETAARKVLGKLKAQGIEPREMWEIAESALDNGTPDPVPYLLKAAEALIERRSQPFDPMLQPEDWRQHRWMAEFAEGKFAWDLRRGPKPGEPGCRVAPEIQREFDVEPARPQAIGSAA